MSRIIVVDDDPVARQVLTRLLAPKHEVSAFANGEEAFRHFVAKGADVILTDLKMPRMNGFELLAKARTHDPEAIVFVITGYSSIDNAVAAIKKGACDYIAKPFEPDDVLIRVERALRERELRGKVERLQQERSLKNVRGAPLTRDPKMLEVLDLARKVARTDSSVLIQGETGVGKELVARLIHQESPRRDNAFIAVNCSALPEGVMESELFGHEKGAFTGAVNRRVGYFELADKGTLLLDEIGTAGHNFQVKLLRVLQERIIHRVGSPAPIPVDARVLAATNQDLESEARDELFRSDLLYRLNVVTLKIPPLRERRSDIPLLCEHFLARHGKINPRVASVSPEGMNLLQSYDYPGNVRELENIIERAFILETGPALTPESLLLPSNAATTPPAPPKLTIEDAEKDHILRVLEQCNGKKTEAARTLGINKTTLWRKMKRYGLDET